ncbi:MAG: hypothetical protein IPL76_10465 [Gemmatimonadetes bacterium]|nr:hypothetical protein [Gemmatimonadota bacterium]
MNKNNPITNEAEAWAVLAELIEGARTLPKRELGPDPAGLCSVITDGCLRGVFSRATYNAMHNRIRRALGPRKGWLCRPCLWRPRVMWCRLFAEQAAQEGV